MSITPWQERILSLLEAPGEWRTLSTHERSVGATEQRRRVADRSRVQDEIDLDHVEFRVKQLDDGLWHFQGRYVVSVDTPRSVVVTTPEGVDSTMAVGRLTVTPGVVSKAKRWHGSRKVLVLEASSPAHHNVMRWCLPEPVAQYLRLALNQAMGTPLKHHTDTVTGSE